MKTAFLIALQFLTRLPVSRSGEYSEKAVRQSLVFYPWVGLLMGLVLMLVAQVLGSLPVFVNASLLLLLWVMFTGGLHLDGLADSADAWAGGLGDAERSLDIMKDPHLGPMAVVVLVLVLLLKFSALVSLSRDGLDAALIIAPVLARAFVPVLFLTTPYVRARGLGSVFADVTLSRELALSLLGVVLLMLFTGWAGIVAMLACVLVFAGLRWLMLQRLGGATGDTAGAMIEILETLCLLVVASQ